MSEINYSVILGFNKDTSSFFSPFQAFKTMPDMLLEPEILKKVFLTGATGRIGHPLLKYLLSTGHEVNVVARRAKRCEMLHWPHTKVFIGDLSDTEMLASAMEGCECIYHTAGFAKLWTTNIRNIYETNVQGTANVLIEARRQKIKKIVYTSSSNVFGPSAEIPLDETSSKGRNLVNHYDLSKLQAETMVKEATSPGFKTVVVNPTRVFGGGLMNPAISMDRLMMDLLHGKWIIVPGCNDVTVNYAFMEDVVRGHVLAMERGRSGEQYILGGDNTSYRDLYTLLKRITGKSIYLKLPLAAMKFIGKLQLLNYYLFSKEPAFTSATIERFYQNSMFSSQKAEEELGYQITPLPIALENTLTQMRLLKNMV